MARRVKLTRRKNAATQELPYGKWIPATAVKFNSNGTTSIKSPGRRRNISDGYVDSHGIFHPIRWATDYDPDRADEDSEYAISPSSAYYKRHPGMRKPKRTAKRKKARRRR
jgi:hypothetical protein